VTIVSVALSTMSISIRRGEIRLMPCTVSNFAAERSPVELEYFCQPFADAITAGQRPNALVSGLEILQHLSITTSRR